MRENLHIITEMAGVLAGLYLMTRPDPEIKTIGIVTVLIDSFFLLTWNGD